MKLMIEMVPATPLCMQMHNATLGLIELLIDASPDSVRHEDNYGFSPLHWLCNNDVLDETSALEILQLLLEKYPESIRHAGNGSHLPIHIAAII